MNNGAGHRITNGDEHPAASRVLAIVTEDMETGRSSMTSASDTSAVSQVSVSINKLHPDDKTRLDTTSRLERKLRMLEYIAEIVLLGRVVVIERCVG